MYKKHTGKLSWIWLICVTALMICSFLVSGCTGIGQSDFEVPLNLSNASEVGSLRFELVYDAEVLQVSEVKAGDLASTAMIEFNTDSPGSVVIGIVDVSGISGDIQVATVKFKVLQNGAECPLTIENVLAHDVKTLNTLPFTSTPGEFGRNAGSVTFPVLKFNP